MESCGPAVIPERGIQFLPPPEGGSTFLDALIRSATHSEAQIFTEATPPFKICHANNAWSLLCGYSVPEVLGKTCKILQGPETDPDRLRDLHAGIAANSKTTVQLVNYTKNAERFLNELTIEPLMNQTGEVTHFIGTLSPVLRPASMSAASAQLCGALTADKLEKSPAALGNRGESSPGRGSQGAVERGAPSGAVSGASAAGASGAGMPGAQGSGAPQAEYTDLLSRGSFPLHTLNHHPNAPVLLRMLQLNNCSMGRASFPGRSLDSQASSQPSGMSSRSGEWQLSAERAAVMASSTQGQPSPTAEGMSSGEWPQLSALLAKAWSRRGAGASPSERPSGVVERQGQGQVGTGSWSSSLGSGATQQQGAMPQGAMPQGSIALPSNLQNHHGEASDQQRCDTESFLAAVAGQGVLTSSWPASHVTCNAHAPASHVRNVCGDGSAPASHVSGGGGSSCGLGLSVSSSLSGLGDQGPLSPSRGPLSPRSYEQPQYGKRTCGDPSGPPEMRQRLQQLQQLQQLQGLQQLPPTGFPQQQHSSSSCPASPQSQLHQQQKQAQASQQMAQSQQLQQQQSAQQSALLLQQQQQLQQLSQLHERENGQGSCAAALLKASREPTPFPPRLGRGGFQSLHSLSAQLGTRTSRLASTGGPGPEGQWAAAATQDAVGLPLHRRVPSSPRLSSSPTPLVGADDIIELDDIFDVLDNWDDFEKQPELKDLEAEIKGAERGGGEIDDGRTMGVHAASARPDG